MKIVRYISDGGEVAYGDLQPDGFVRCIAGDIYRTFDVSEQQSMPNKLLPPIIPAAIWGIGLNYKKHAAEAGVAIPDVPVVFAKGPNAIQNLGDPIILPRFLKSDEVGVAVVFTVDLCYVAVRTKLLSSDQLSD